MTQERKVQLGSEVDATGAKQGFEAIKQAGAQAADAISKSAGQAGQAVDGIGDGATKSAAKLAAAEKNIIGSIQRATAAAQAGERGTAAFYEALAKQRGVSAETLRPYLDQLRAAETASRTAAAGVDRIGMSAAQTAAALRGVPAQFTDIFTSIAAGQQPLTVVLQQGGQLKDVFGGALPAARALGGYVAGLITPFTAAAAAAAALAYAYKLGSDEAVAYAQALILSGNAAGVTAGQLQEMARGVAAMGAGTQGRAAKVLTQIASAAGIGAGNMQRFTAAAVAFERAGGPAAEETAKAFASLAKEPLAASLKLNEATNYLTASTVQQIKALEDAGRSADAARLAQEAYAAAIETRTPQMVATLGTLESIWARIKKEAAGAIDAIKNAGRPLLPSEQIQALENRIASIKAGNEGAAGKSRLPELQQEVDYWRELVRLNQRSADAAAQQAWSTKAVAEWSEKGKEFADAKAKRDAELLREAVKGRELVNAGLITEAQLRERLTAITEKYADKAKAKAPELPHFKDAEDGAKTYMRALDGIQKIALDATASAEGLTKTQAKLREVMADPAWASYSRQQRERIIMDASEAQAKEDVAGAHKAAAEAAKASAREYEQWIGSLDRSADAIARQVAQTQLEVQAHDLAAQGYYSLAQAIQVVEVARLQEARAVQLSYGDDAAVAAIEREIEARQRLIDVIGQKEQREASDKAAKDAAADWKRAADQIGQSLTDAIMSGGKSGADYIENLFRTMVLRPVVQAIVNPVAGSVLGSLGFSGAAQAAGSAGGLGGAGSVLGLAGALGSLGTGFSAALFNGVGIASNLAAAGSLIGTGTASGIGAGLGMGLGAIAPYAIVAGLILNALGSDKNAKLGYGSSSVSTAGGVSAAGRLFDFGRGTDVGQQDQLQAISQTISASIAAQSKVLGGFVQGLQIQVATDIDRTGKGSGTIQVLQNGQRLGGVQTGGTNPLNTAATKLDDAAKLADWFTQNASAAIIQGLQASQLPKRFADYFAGFSAFALTKTEADAILATATAVQTVTAQVAGLGRSFDQIGAISVAAADQVLQLVGGLDAYQSALGTYYQAYYSDTERVARTTEQLRRELSGLGVALPSTREAYRALVDAQDLTTEAGRQTYAALLRLAGSFDAVTKAAEQAAADQAAAAKRVVDEQVGLETRLLQLQGNTAELRRRELAALAPANRALQERIYALEDAKTAADAAAELRDAWAGVATTIEDEIARIRGLNRSQTASLAQVQAEFATATAQARAGDKDAAARLPELSRTMLELSQKSANSALELSTVRESVAASLAQTAQIARAAGDAAKAAADAKLAPLLQAGATTTPDAQSVLDKLFRKLRDLLAPSGASDSSGQEVGGFAAGGWHAGGLRIVGESGPEIESTGPARIWSAEQTARMLTGGLDGAALLAELRSLRAEVSDLHAAVEATAGHTAAISRLHRRWDDEGLTVRNDIDTPLATSAV